MLRNFPLPKQPLKFEEPCAGNAGNITGLNEGRFAGSIERKRKFVFYLALGQPNFRQCERHTSILINPIKMVKCRFRNKKGEAVASP